MTGLVRLTWLIAPAMLVGCATVGTTYSMDLVPDDHSVLRTGGNGTMLVSQKANMTVALSPTAMWNAGQRPEFTISAYNSSDFDSAFGLDSIRVTYNGESLDIVRPEVLVVEAQNREAQARQTAGMLQVFQVVADQAAITSPIPETQADLVQQLQLEQQRINLLNAVQSAEAGVDLAVESASVAMAKYQEQALQKQISIAPQQDGGGLFMVEPPVEPVAGGHILIMVDVGGRVSRLSHKARQHLAMRRVRDAAIVTWVLACAAVAMGGGRAVNAGTAGPSPEVRGVGIGRRGVSVHGVHTGRRRPHRSRHP